MGSFQLLWEKEGVLSTPAPLDLLMSFREKYGGEIIPSESYCFVVEKGQQRYGITFDGLCLNKWCTSADEFHQFIRN